MEYKLLFENKQKQIALIVAVIAFLLISVYGFYSYGINALFILAAGLVCLSILPILLNRPKIMIFLWLIIYPISQSLLYFNLFSFEGKNAIGLLVTGISLPMLFVIFFQTIKQAIADIPFLKYLLFFDFLTFLSLFRFDGALYNTLLELRIHLVILFLILLVYTYLKNNSPKLIFTYINLFAFANMLVAILQALIRKGAVIIEGVARVRGLMEHPNTCGFLINIYLGYCFYKLFLSESKKDKVIWGCIIFFNILALILTFSKTSYLIFVVNLLILTIFSSFKTQIKNISLVILSTCMIVLLDLLVGLNLSAKLVSRFQNTSSFEWRLEVWSTLLRNMNLLSFFTGYGINSVQKYLLMVRPNDLPVAHNGYIQLLYEYGILGFSYIVAIISVSVSSLRNLAQKSDFNEKIIYLVPLMMACSLLVELMFDVAVSLRESIFYLWTYIVVFYILINQKNSQKADLLNNKLG